MGQEHVGRITGRTSSVIPGISDVVRVEGSLLLVSGQVGISADGSVPADFADELDAAFAALVRALERCGATVRDLARITIYVRDLPEHPLDVIRGVRDRWLDPQALPASALVGVASLFRPDVRVEVDAIAVAGASPEA